MYESKPSCRHSTTCSYVIFNITWTLSHTETSVKCSCRWTGVQWACCLWWCIHFLCWCRITNLPPRAGKKEKDWNWVKSESAVRSRRTLTISYTLRMTGSLAMIWTWAGKANVPTLQRCTLVGTSTPSEVTGPHGGDQERRAGVCWRDGGCSFPPSRRATTAKPGEETKNVPKERGQVRLREMSQSHYRNSDPSRAVDAAHLPPQKTLQKSVCLQVYLWKKISSTHKFTRAASEVVTWTGADRRGPTSVEIRSGRAALIVGEKATARADGCQRRRRRAGHLHTEDVGAAVGEATPEPRWLITADGGVVVVVVVGRRRRERESQVHQQHPRPVLPLQLARIQHPPRRAGWHKPPRHDSADPNPLDGGFVFCFSFFPDVFHESSEAVRFSTVRCCGCSPSVSLWSGLERWITSYLPPRQHPPTADETTGLLVGVQEHILLQNTPLSPLLPAQGPCWDSFFTNVLCPKQPSRLLDNTKLSRVGQCTLFFYRPKRGLFCLPKCKIETPTPNRFRLYFIFNATLGDNRLLFVYSNKIRQSKCNSTPRFILVATTRL